MIPTIIEATTLSDAWFQVAWRLMRGQAGVHIYTIDSGSYVGQQRLEFDFMLLTIKNPGVRPLIPEIPPHLNIPAPVESVEYVEHYFAEYLMDSELKKNEVYKYATWLAPGVERVIGQLRGAPGNNQACISIGGYSPSKCGSCDFYDKDFCSCGEVPKAVAKTLVPCNNTDNFIDPATGQRDPACLRVVDFRLDQQNTLHMFTYWRSWDAWNGLPANLAGLQLLKEYVAQELEAEDGCIIAASKGCHIYSHAIQVAAERCSMASVGTIDDLAKWHEEQNQ